MNRNKSQKSPSLSKINTLLDLNDPTRKNGRKSSVKVPYAEKEGRLVHVSTVERGLKCAAICPVCHQAVVARKGTKIRHHFAHYPGANCSAETALHYIARQLISDKLHAALSGRKGLRVHWKCLVCANHHSLNLLHNVANITTEKALEDCRPDIALLDRNRQPTALIEIVVSHRPDQAVLALSARRQIPLLIFRLNTATDLEELERSPLLSPTVVLYCPRQQCQQCGAPLFAKRLYILDGRCWRCGGPMKIAFLDVNNKLFGPAFFSENDRLYARERGVAFRQHFNHKRQETEITLACPICGTVTGNRYLGFYKKRKRKLPGTFRGQICLQCRTSIDI